MPKLLIAAFVFEGIGFLILFASAIALLLS